MRLEACPTSCTDRLVSTGSCGLGHQSTRIFISTVYIDVREFVQVAGRAGPEPLLSLPPPSLLAGLLTGRRCDERRPPDRMVV